MGGLRQRLIIAFVLVAAVSAGVQAGMAMETAFNVAAERPKGF